MKDGVGTVRYPRIEARDEDCAKKLAKRTLTNLYNEYPEWLYHAHTKLDAAVALGYRWNDLPEIIERGRSMDIYDFKTGRRCVGEIPPADLTTLSNNSSKTWTRRFCKDCSP